MKNLLVAWKDAAPAAAAITAVISALVALTVLIYTRNANRRRATLDMVMKTLMDDSVQAGNARFKAVLRKDQDAQDQFCLADLAIPEKRGDPDRVIVLRQLNIYELMALGIKRGTFDEAFYKRWYRNQFMLDYEACRSFIEGLQSHKSTIFCEYTRLYRKWEKRGLPGHNPNRFVMAYYALTQQHDKIDAAREAMKAR